MNNKVRKGRVIVLVHCNTTNLSTYTIFMLIPFVVLEYCSGQNVVGRTNKAATLCSPFKENKNVKTILFSFRCQSNQNLSFSFCKKCLLV